MSVDINKLDLSRFPNESKRIIGELAKVINDNEVSKDQFEMYANALLENPVEKIASLYEDDCAKGTLLLDIYHQDILDDLKEHYRIDVNNKYYYFEEEEK